MTPRKDLWWNSEPTVKSTIESAGIRCDDEYLAYRANLDPGARRAADLCRFAYGREFSSSSPTKLLRWCPPELLQIKLSALDLSTRVRRCMKRAGISLVSDLLNWPDNRLIGIPNFGQLSLRKLFDAISEVALDADFYYQSVSSTADSPIGMENSVAAGTVPASELQYRNLSSIYDQFVESQTARDLLIMQGRFGEGGTVVTLEDLGRSVGLTRERVRQIEKKKLKVLRLKHTLEDQIVGRIERLLEYRESPLHLAILSGEDVWFAGFEARQLVLARLLELLSAGQLSIFDVRGMRVVSKGNKDDYAAAVRDTRAVFEKIAVDRPTRTEMQVVAQSIARARRCEELYSDVLKDLSNRCFFSKRKSKQERLIAFGLSADTLVKAVLEEADFPLHYNDIHRLAEELGQKTLEVRRVHNAAAEIGTLLGRGTYGLWKHVSANPSQARAIVDFVEDLVLEGDAARQWHSSELLDEIQLASIDAPADLDHYTLTAVLLKFSGLDYLGRFIWTIEASSAHASRERIDVRQAVLSIVREFGRPMTTDEIRRDLEEHRGLGQHFQIHLGGDLIRLNSGLWGLMSRDLPIELTDADRCLNFIERRLQVLGHGLTNSEVVAEIEAWDEAPDISSVPATFWVWYASKDRRFRVSSNNLIWLRQWQSPNRMSAKEAVAMVLADALEPLSLEEVAACASDTAQRDIETSATSAALRQMGARFSSALGGWSAPD